MMYIYLGIRSLITYVLWAVICCVGLIVCVPCALLPRSIRYDNRIYFFCTMLWNYLLIRVAGVRFLVTGMDNMPVYPDNPSIFVMNHGSSLDIFFAEMLVGSYPHIWMSKREYGRIPLFNILLRQMNVLVQRDNPYQAAKALTRMYTILREGSRHGLLFPEGRRYADGNIHPFHNGFAVLSHKLSRPVIPILLLGTEKILPAKRWLINTLEKPIKVIIGAPMNPEKGQSIKAFCDKVRTWFVETKEKYAV